MLIQIFCCKYIHYAISGYLPHVYVKPEFKLQYSGFGIHQEAKTKWF